MSTESYFLHSVVRGNNFPWPYFDVPIQMPKKTLNLSHWGWLNVGDASLLTGAMDPASERGWVDLKSGPLQKLKCHHSFCKFKNRVQVRQLFRFWYSAPQFVAIWRRAQLQGNVLLLWKTIRPDSHLQDTTYVRQVVSWSIDRRRCGSWRGRFRTSSWGTARTQDASGGRCYLRAEW